MEWKTTSEQTWELAPGLRLVRAQLRSTHLKETVYRLELEDGAPYVDWFPVSSGDRIVRLETVGNMIQEVMQRKLDVVAGINGDFFSYTGVPSGLQIKNREVYTSPPKSKVVLAGMRDRSFQLRENIELNCFMETERGSVLQVDMVNRPRLLKHENHAVVYNFRFGRSTRTPEGGCEAVIRMDGHAALLAGGQLAGTVENVYPDRSDSPLENGILVLSASGAKAQWMMEHLRPGVRVTLHLGFSQDIDSAEQAISGNSTLAAVLLRDGKMDSRLLDASLPIHTDRHPRTIAATKSGKLNLFVIDGRQPGHSDGMTMAESAAYLQMLGMEQAINLDGGGSSTCYARLPGEEKPILVNSPSDGFERAVGNGIVIVNTAPMGELERLYLFPSLPAAVLARSHIVFQVKGVDPYLHPVSLQQESVVWKLHGEAGRIDGNGRFTAGKRKAKGWLEARIGRIRTRGDIHIVDRIARLELDPPSVVIEEGGSLKVRVKALDDEGKEVLCSNDVFRWKTTGGIGIVRENGVFEASAAGGRGEIIAEYGSVCGKMQVQVGKPHALITGFEDLNDLTVSFAAAVPGSVTLQKVARPQPVRFGTFAAKLTYDFRGQSGLSRACIHFAGPNGSLGKTIEGKPIRFGLWVYGDGNGHWLRLGIRDGNGHPISLNLTENGGLTWHDWKYVGADVPDNIAGPVTVTHISLVETNDRNKNAGAIYLDQFRAEYTDLNEDVTGPEFADLFPPPNAQVADARPVIGVRILDSESGVDPASIRMKVNGTPVGADYHAETGLLVWQPEKPLREGICEVEVRAQDKAGNPSVPPAAWSFVILRNG